jgi:hypothetical protein
MRYRFPYSEIGGLSVLVGDALLEECVHDERANRAAGISERRFFERYLLYKTYKLRLRAPPGLRNMQIIRKGTEEDSKKMHTGGRNNLRESKWKSGNDETKALSVT